MCRRLCCFLVVLAFGMAVPSAAWSFDDFGLDLTGEDDDDDAGFGLDLSADEPEPEPPPPSREPRAAAEEDDGLAVPADRIFTAVDRVKVVQRKLILKKGRFEVAPAFSVSVNDPFFRKIGGGLSAVYWPADTLGVFADVFYLQTLETENVTLARQAYRSLLLESRLRLITAVGFQWSPIYGKVAWFNRDIIHFDVFFSGGFGLVGTSTGTHLATTVGVGQRYLVNRWLGLFFKVENRLFPELYPLRGGHVSSLSNVLTLSLGASIYFPMDFDYSIQ
jgi:outer membrane beta-barrel protein